MRKTIGCLLLASFLLSPCFVCAADGWRTPFSNKLEKAVQSRPGVKANPGMNRLSLMRFYFPTEAALPEPGLMTKLFNAGVTGEHARALAFYLFNMYVSMAAYGGGVPGELTFNYLGVLDAFSLTSKPFDFAEAPEFYQDNKEEIKNWLQQFFAKGNLADYDVKDPQNDARELAFARLLARSPRVGRQATYRPAAVNLLKSAPSEAESRLVASLVRESFENGKQKVVLFEQPKMADIDADAKFKATRGGMDRTYRCVSDECEYCSYLFGRRVCGELAGSDGNWGAMRMYKVTARAAKGEFLQPVSGERFVLADGKTAPNWRYHTATLLVMNRDGRFTALVADTFLAGTEPVAFDAWIKRYAADNTLFTADPFVRNAAADDAIKTPSSRVDGKVLVDGRTYNPHPVGD